MSVKIILSRTTEPAEKRELLFDGDTISIGREPSNTLPLQGTQVSKAHARIERQRSEYFIVDLDSTNSTYINGEKLIPGKQAPLHHGDRVSISDYDLQFFSMDPLSSPPADQGQKRAMENRNTAVDLPGEKSRAVSPEEHPSDFVQRWSELTAEIQRTLQTFDILDFARRHQELQARCDALAEENRMLKTESLSLPNNGELRTSMLPASLPADEARAEQVLLVLLHLFFKLSSGRSSFLSEFIVRTVVRTSDGLPAQPRSDADVLRYFTSAQLSDREFAERLALLKQEADRIVLHMMGLLEGYRRSVDEGARRILQRVDPDRLEEDLPDTVLLRYFPPLADLKLFQVVRNRLRDLLQEDRGVLEKQVFRPGFVRAYEECIEPATRE